MPTSNLPARVLPDEECETEFSQTCRLKARWINVAICFGVDLQDVFRIGMRMNIVQDCDLDLDVDDDDRAVYYTAYQNIIKFVPGLNNLIALNGDGDSESLHKYIDIMQKGCNTARSDTFKRVNQLTDRYLNSGARPIQCGAGTMRKTSRGLNHPQIGRLIIPAKYVAEWDENPVCSRAYFNTGQNQIMGYSMPLFLYYEYEYDPSDPDDGLFRSAFLVCVLVDILYGPQAVDTEGAKRFELFRHHCVGDMYDVEMITAPMIAYAAVVGRFALSSRRVWNYKEDNFDYRTFYRVILLRLSDPSDPWVEELFKWWNDRVFGNEEGKMATLNKDDQEREEWEEFAQRKAARKARAAVNRTQATPSGGASTPYPSEVPVGASEDNEPDSPGDTVPPSGDANPYVPVSGPDPEREPSPPEREPPPPEREPSPLSPEREPSPLSPLGNPPDEETSIGTIGGPSSCTRKRKSTKGNTGRAKAPPKQRRKTVEGSQPCSARV